MFLRLTGIGGALAENAFHNRKLLSRVCDYSSVHNNYQLETSTRERVICLSGRQVLSGASRRLDIGFTTMVTPEAKPQCSVTALPWPSTDLAPVMALHGANSKTLGPFPVGAFEEYAQKRQILVAWSPCGDVLGYLLYRISRQRASIVHLCVDPAHRAGGIAQRLVDALKIITKHLTGVGLRCRQDNYAKLLWPRMGFAAMGRKPGRGRDGHELTFWWFDHGHPDLLSNKPTEDRRSCVVIDANVFFDLKGSEGRKGEESQALLADWVQGAIELHVTKETHNEIERATDKKTHAESRAHATRYPTLATDDKIFQRICQELKPLFPNKSNLRDSADLRQIAYAIAGGALFFATRDETLISRCDSLYDTYGIHVLAPGELIRRLDMLEREEEYRPARVHGPRLRTCALTAEHLDDTVKAFVRCTTEKQNEFRREVLHWVGRPRSAQTNLLADSDGKPVLLTVLDQESPGVLAVPLLRTTRHPLSGTLLRSFLRSALDLANKDKRLLVSIPDVAVDDPTRAALREFAFSLENEKWVKITKRTLGDFESLHALVGAAATLGLGKQIVESARQAVDAAKANGGAERTAVLESFFWPAKLLTDSLPVFIIPIRAEWAQHFFDEQLGSELLFGLREELHLGVEGVYYRSPKQSHLSAPARILWYVSQGHAKRGSKSIKACSRLDSIEIGDAEEIYRRYRRLGVYTRRDVLNAVKGKPSRDLMALRFSMTERFTTPVNVPKLDPLGLRGPFMSPRRISAEQFASIYSIGFDMAP